MVRQIVSLYEFFSSFGSQWHESFNDLLLWKNMQVELDDGSCKYSGKLLGINEKGGLQLLCSNDVIDFFGGNLGLAK